MGDPRAAHHDDRDVAEYEIVNAKERKELEMLAVAVAGDLRAQEHAQETRRAG
jgi:hypothetical protein